MPKFAKTHSGPLPSVWAHQAIGTTGRPVTKQEGVLDRVKARTLILVGQGDWIYRVTEAQWLIKGIQDSRLVVFDKSGHFPWIEAPKQLLAEVDQLAK
jgi:proline iminopeptidase